MDHWRLLKVTEITKVAGGPWGTGTWADRRKENEFMKKSEDEGSQAWNQEKYHKKQGPTIVSPSSAHNEYSQ